jgi:hypothetical protein
MARFTARRRSALLKGALAAFRKMTNMVLMGA